MIVGENFPNVRNSVVGLAMAFPGAAMMESDFSTMDQEVPASRSGLCDIFLGGYTARQAVVGIQTVALPANCSILNLFVNLCKSRGAL